MTMLAYFSLLVDNDRNFWQLPSQPYRLDTRESKLKRQDYQLRGQFQQGYWTYSNESHLSATPIQILYAYS